MTILRKIFLFILIVSPLLSITGGNEFSTGLNLAAILALPSLNPINYVFLLFFLFLFVALNIKRSRRNLALVGYFVLCFLFFFHRHATIYSFLGMISIFACFLPFMKDKAGLTQLTDNEQRLLYRIYWIYIIVSLVVHFYLIVTGEYYANDRMMGIFKNPNQLGFFLAAFYLMYVLKLKPSESLFSNWIFPLFILVLIAMTGSRSALAAMAGCFFLLPVIRQRWASFATILALVGIFFVMAAVYIGTEDAIEAVSRRDSKSLEAVGNMRFQILEEIIEESSAQEIMTGQDVSVGTNGMIHEQNKIGEDHVIWLDNLVNVLMYNWGLWGILGYTVFLMVELTRYFPVVHRDFLVVIFYTVASFFFVLADFFPLVFLVVYLKNEESA
jgi:hypothetical protein